MKFKWDKKYLYWGATAFFVLAGGILCYYLVFHNNSLKGHLSNLFSITMPIIDGMILAYLMAPIVRFLEEKILFPFKERLNKKYPKTATHEKKIKRAIRGIAILLTLIFVIFVIQGFLRFVIPQIADSIKSIASQYNVYVENLTAWIQKLLVDYPELGNTLNNLWATYSPDLELFWEETIMPQINSLLKTVSLSVIGVAKALWNLIIGLIISIYLLGNKERFLSQAKKIVYAFLNTEHGNTLVEVCRLTNKTFGGFINGKILDSAIIGVICFFCVSIMKMPYPMLIAVIIGVTNVIPFFGPFIGAIPCALLVLMVDPLKCLYFVIFVLILQQFDGNVLGPKILGDSTGLSGFWVIFSITLFSGLMGFAGMILGVPVFAVFYTLVREKVNSNLEKKGMSTETEEYRDLDHVDPITRKIVGSKPDYMKDPDKITWNYKLADWQEEVQEQETAESASDEADLEEVEEDLE